MGRFLRRGFLMKFTLVLGTLMLFITVLLIGFVLWSPSQVVPVNRVTLATEIVMTTPAPSISVINQLREELVPQVGRPTTNAFETLQQYVKIIEAEMKKKSEPSSSAFTNRQVIGRLLIDQCAREDQYEAIVFLSQQNRQPLWFSIGLALLSSLFLVWFSISQRRLIQQVQDVLTGETQSINDTLKNLRFTILQLEKDNTTLRKDMLSLKLTRPLSDPPTPPANGPGPSFPTGSQSQISLGQKSAIGENPAPRNQEMPHCKAVQSDANQAQEMNSPTPSVSLAKPTLHMVTEMNEKENLEPKVDTSAESVQTIHSTHYTGGFRAFKPSSSTFTESPNAFQSGEFDFDTQSRTVVVIEILNLNRLKQIYHKDYEQIHKAICQEILGCLKQVTTEEIKVTSDENDLYWEIPGIVPETAITEISQQFQNLYQNVELNRSIDNELIRITTPPVTFKLFGDNPNPDYRALAL